jgi:hypothetical protein
VAPQRGPELGELDAQATLGQLGHSGGVAAAPDEGGEHGPARHPQDVAGHRRQLDARVFQHLLQALGLAGALLDDDLAVAGEVAQLADRAGWHKARADQAVLDQLADPGRIGHVGRAARHMVQVGRVQQPALELVLQQLPDRLPVAPGRLHPHPAHPQAAQPLRQQPQPGGGRGEPTGLGVAPTMTIRHPHTRGHGVLVHVQAGATRHQRLHLLAPPLDNRSLPSGGASTRGI